MSDSPPAWEFAFAACVVIISFSFSVFSKLSLWGLLLVKCSCLSICSHSLVPRQGVDSPTKLDASKKRRKAGHRLHREIRS